MKKISTLVITLLVSCSLMGANYNDTIAMNYENTPIENEEIEIVFMNYGDGEQGDSPICL